MQQIPHSNSCVFRLGNPTVPVVEKPCCQSNTPFDGAFFAPPSTPMGDFLKMQKNWKTSTLFTLVALVAGAIVFSSNTVEARPKYRTEFQKKYDKVAANNKITCFACHGKNDEGMMDKEKRNIYAQALEKSLVKKNEMDVDTIKAALTKIESEKNPENGKTFGDSLNSGQLPVKEEE
jgi:hypothetical protein